MRLWVRKCSSFEEEAKADREFWARFSPEERVAMVEELREEEWRRRGEGEPRLQRVARVLDAPWR
jgi:hypothetical protein